MPIALNGNGPITGLGPMAQCTLQLYSGNAFLFGLNGNLLYIDGQNRVIPNSAIALSPGGLTVGTTYFVYAYMNGTTMTLEASTTVKAWDQATGMYFKTGDSTRTLVGMVRPITGPAFADSLTQRFVASWYNRREVMLQANTAGHGGLSSNSPVAVPNFAKLEFLCWNDEAIEGSICLLAQHASNNGIVYAGLGLDATNSTVVNYGIYQAYLASANGPISQTIYITTTEGYHYLSLNGLVSSGSGYIAGGGSILAKVRI